MRRFLSILAATTALGLAPAAMAQTWSAADNTGAAIESNDAKTRDFGAWFGYDALGVNTFLTFDGSDFDNAHANGTFYQPRGGSPLGTAAGSCATPTQTAAGSIRLTFATARSGTMQRNGGATETLTRTEIASGYPEPRQSANYPQTGWYWNSDCAGQGAHVEVMGDTIFGLVYGYDENGAGRWYFFNGGLVTTQNGTSIFSGPLNLCSRETGSTVCPSVGNITGVFTNNTVTITYPNGVSVRMVPFPI